MNICGEPPKPNQRAIAKMLSLGLAGGMSAMELATAISERHPSVTTDALAILIARQQQSGATSSPPGGARGDLPGGR